MNAAAIPEQPTAEIADSPSAAPPRSLSRRILGGGAWSIAGRVGSMGSLFLMNTILARKLPTGQYSAFLAAASLTPFLAMLATLGAPYTLVRLLRREEPAWNDRRRNLRGALLTTLMGGAITALAFVVLGSYFFPGDEKWMIVRDYPAFICCWFVLSALCVIGACFLQGVDDFRTAALIGARSGGLIPNGVTMAAVAGAAMAGVLTLDLLLASQIIGYVAASCLAIVAIRSFLNVDRQSGPTVSASALARGDADRALGVRWYVIESWPNLINQAINVALLELDLFWVTCLAGEETVAEYGVVRNLRLLVTAPLLIGTVALAPFVAELYSKGDLKRLERLLRGTATLLAIPSLIALFAVLAAAELIIHLTFGEDFVQAAPALRMASVGCIIFVISGNNGLALTMTGRHRDLLVCSVISLGLYLAVSPALVDRYGVFGAATAFTIQMVVINVLATVRVAQTVGVWTIPLCSVGAVREEWAQLRHKLRHRKR